MENMEYVRKFFSSYPLSPLKNRLFPCRKLSKKGINIIPLFLFMMLKLGHHGLQFSFLL